MDESFIVLKKKVKNDPGSRVLDDLQRPADDEMSSEDNEESENDEISAESHEISAENDEISAENDETSAENNEISTENEEKMFQSVLYTRYQKIENLSCVPYYLGHKPQADSQLFRHQLGIKTCETYAQGEYQIVGEKILASCSNKKTPVFHLGKTRDAEKFGKFDINFTEIETREISVNFSSSEYLAFHCGIKGKGRMILKNKFDPKVAENAEKIQNLLKNTEKINNLTVILLVVDSTSRQSFFRNLPQVSKYFSEKFKKPDPNFILYDFLFNHAIASKTLPNLIPILTGHSLKSLSETLSNHSIDNDSHSEVFKSIEKKTLWSYFKERGFVTHFSYDTVSDYLSTIVGRSISSDHILSNFWHLSEKLFYYSDFNERSQCIADRYPHDYSFSYMQDFIENYQNSNKFIYTHLSVAHEKSGTRLATMDKGLLSFIVWTLDKFRDNNLTFFLMSDHGRPGGSPAMGESRAEVVLPFNFMLASQSVIKSLKAHHHLKANTKKMTSRYDLFKTLALLAHFPYENYSQLRKTSQNITSEIKAINLFFEDIPDSRTCKDVGVPSEFCFCSNWKEVDPKDWKNDVALKFLIEASLDYLNQKRPSNENCPSLQLEQILVIKTFSFNEMDEFEPVHYDIQALTNFGTTFNVKGSRASAEKYENLSNRYYLNLKYRFSFNSRDGRETYMLAKVWEVTGENNCAGSNEGKLFVSGINLKGTCSETCRDSGRVCKTPDFSEDFLNTLKTFGQVHDTGKRSIIQNYGTMVFITSGDHCNSEFSNIKHICNCMKQTTPTST